MGLSFRVYRVGEQMIPDQTGKSRTALGAVAKPMRLNGILRGMKLQRLLFISLILIGVANGYAQSKPAVVARQLHDAEEGMWRG